MRKALLLTAVGGTLALSGCDAVTEIACNGLAAGIGGSHGGGLVAHNLTSGGGCRRIAGAVRRSLDAQDQRRYDFATAQVLQQRLPAAYYRPGFQAPSYQTASGYGAAVPSGGGRPTASDATPAAPAASGRVPGLAPVKGATWVSDHSGTSGSVEVIAAERPRDGRGECRTVAQTVRTPGETPVSETSRFCESSPGAADWTKI